MCTLFITNKLYAVITLLMLVDCGNTAHTLCRAATLHKFITNLYRAESCAIAETFTTALELSCHSFRML